MRKRKFISQPINEKLSSQCKSGKQSPRSANMLTIFESRGETKFNYSIIAKNDKLRLTSVIVIFYFWTIIFQQCLLGAAYKTAAVVWQYQLFQAVSMGKTITSFSWSQWRLEKFCQKFVLSPRTRELNPDLNAPVFISWADSDRIFSKYKFLFSSFSDSLFSKNIGSNQLRIPNIYWSAFLLPIYHSLYVANGNICFRHFIIRIQEELSLH